MSLIADEYISKMRPPSDMHIICIDITNKCDLACSNCTRLLENQESHWDMSIENFAEALDSLKNYEGVRAVIGGNPCMHRNFDVITKTIVEKVPDKKKRGLWTNNFFKYRDLALSSYGTFNLNTHGDKRAEKSLSSASGVGKVVYTGHSEHSPILTAVRDLYPDEDLMWDKISKCDINQGWSATIIENKGKAKAYFCEVAASFDLARGQDHGISLTEDWWEQPIEFFSTQIKHFCPGCGVPAKLKGYQDSNETDAYTKSNEDIASISQERNGRNVVFVDSILNAEFTDQVTFYNVRQKGNAWKRFKRKFRKVVSNLMA